MSEPRLYTKASTYMVLTASAMWIRAHQGKLQLLIHVHLTSLMKVNRINTANTD